MSAIFKNGTWYGNGGGGSIDVDSDFSTTSENPVQNKVITGAIGNLNTLDTDASNLVGAVNETLGKGGTKISQAEFDVLSQAEKDNGTAWYIYDGEFENNFMAHTGFTPIGTIISVMGTTAPNHYLACEGQVVSIAAYPELAKYFEQQFGTKNYFGGDGTTTFGIPDLRGEFLRGTGTNSHTDQGNGANVGVHQDGTLHTGVWGSDSQNGIAQTSWDRTNQVSSVKADFSIPVTTMTHNNMVKDSSVSMSIYTSRPTNTSVLYCIATKNIYIDVKNQYSTDEMVVGTWLDGKPLYQKTINNLAITSNSQNIDIMDTSGVSSIINAFGIATQNNAQTQQVILPTFTGSDALSIVRASSTNKLLLVTSGYSGYTAFVTLQYTKTTD